MIPSVTLPLPTGLDECDFCEGVAQNSAVKKWRIFLLRLSHKSSVTSRRMPCVLLGGPTISYLFKMGSLRLVFLLGLLLIPVTPHAFLLVIKCHHSNIFHPLSATWGLWWQWTATVLACYSPRDCSHLSRRKYLLEDIIWCN